MTEDTPPENLRKFLESDDPAMVRMGISMAKGTGVSENLLVEILWMYMLHDDKTIRAAAKSTFIKIAPEDTKQTVKENWKAIYRTQGDYHRVGILGKALRQTSVCLVERIIKAFEGGNSGPAEALGIIGEPAVEPLIKALGDKKRRTVVRKEVAKTLGVIGDKRAVEPLIKVLGDKRQVVHNSAIRALGKIGDKRAVEPLIKALSDEYSHVRAAIRALGEIGDKRAVEPLIKALEDKNSVVREFAAYALGKIGDKRAIKPLINALARASPIIDRERWGMSAHYAITGALGEIGDIPTTETETFARTYIEILKSKSQPSRMFATYALGKIGSVKGLEIALRDKNEFVRNEAKEALKKLGHEVE